MLVSGTWRLQAEGLGWAVEGSHSLVREQGPPGSAQEGHQGLDIKEDFLEVVTQAGAKHIPTGLKEGQRTCLPAGVSVGCSGRWWGKCGCLALSCDERGVPAWAPEPQLGAWGHLETGELGQALGGVARAPGAPQEEAFSASHGTAAPSHQGPGFCPPPPPQIPDPCPGLARSVLGKYPDGEGGASGYRSWWCLLAPDPTLPLPWILPAVLVPGRGLAAVLRTLPMFHDEDHARALGLPEDTLVLP